MIRVKSIIALIMKGNHPSGVYRYNHHHDRPQVNNIKILIKWEKYGETDKREKL